MTTTPPSSAYRGSEALSEVKRKSFVTSRTYEERVYAGVLGKIIGVYLGRPIEGWWNDHIEKTLGEIQYYVYERLGRGLVEADDDITGTFAFVRALPENGNDPRLTAAQIGDWWLNTAIEERSIFWWGGMAMSTEHTAYLRLKAGHKAPESGSIALNGKIVAEQIGAQIFIDAWGMICPGDPQRAAHFAGLAASVSHDGEAKYAAQVVASMEALAFVEPDLHKLLDVGASLIPTNSVIHRLISDVREWAAASGDDWRATFKKIQENYGYDKFTGACHMVPNHAVILLALLHGNDDFQRSLMIANTAGWDTDCNSGNVGAIMGIKNGLDAIDNGPDWRGPVSDRLYLPTADGGRCITDAVRETYEVVNIGRALAKESPESPKNGARFHFTLPGSVQGFAPENAPQTRGTASVHHSDGKLAIELSHVTVGRTARVGTATFLSPAAVKASGYGLTASPTLYTGQRVWAEVTAVDLPFAVEAGLYLRVFNDDDTLSTISSTTQTLSPGQRTTLRFTVPDTGGQPVAEVGLEISSSRPVSGRVILDFLTWDGVPDVVLDAPEKGSLWQKAWVSAVSNFSGGRASGGYAYRVIHNEGTGVVTQGEWSWSGYTVSGKVLPHCSDRVGLIGACRGLRRYVAIVLDKDKKVRLIRQHDSDRSALAEFDTLWSVEEPVSLSLTIDRDRIVGTVNGESRSVSISSSTSGAVGMLLDTGHAQFSEITVRPCAT